MKINKLTAIITVCMMLISLIYGVSAALTNTKADVENNAANIENNAVDIDKLVDLSKQQNDRLIVIETHYEHIKEKLDEIYEEITEE